MSPIIVGLKFKRARNLLLTGKLKAEIRLNDYYD